MFPDKFPESTSEVIPEPTSDKCSALKPNSSLHGSPFKFAKLPLLEALQSDIFFTHPSNFLISFQYESEVPPAEFPNFFSKSKFDTLNSCSVFCFTILLQSYIDLLPSVQEPPLNLNRLTEIQERFVYYSPKMADHAVCTPCTHHAFSYLGIVKIKPSTWVTMAWRWRMFNKQLRDWPID
jgi:hypothetical protein